MDRLVAYGRMGLKGGVADRSGRTDEERAFVLPYWPLCLKDRPATWLRGLSTINRWSAEFDKLSAPLQPCCVTLKPPVDGAHAERYDLCSTKRCYACRA